MDLIEYPDRDMMMIDIAQKLAGDLNRALKAKDRVLLAVPVLFFGHAVKDAGSVGEIGPESFRVSTINPRVVLFGGYREGQDFLFGEVIEPAFLCQEPHGFPLSSHPIYQGSHILQLRLVSLAPPERVSLDWQELSGRIPWASLAP